MKINFLTSNEYKYSIAAGYFDRTEGIELVRHDFEVEEIQDVSSVRIAEQAALTAAKALGEPCVKLDVSFCINALGGFPGPFVKYINDWLSPRDIIAMLEGKGDRSARFFDATVVGFPDGTSKVFTKTYEGTITETAEGNDSPWVANELFVPKGHNKSLANFTLDEQMAYWGDGVWPEVAAYFSAEYSELNEK